MCVRVGCLGKRGFQLSCTCCCCFFPQETPFHVDDPITTFSTTTQNMLWCVASIVLYGADRLKSGNSIGYQCMADVDTVLTQQMEQGTVFPGVRWAECRAGAGGVHVRLVPSEAAIILPARAGLRYGAVLPNWGYDIGRHIDRPIRKSTNNCHFRSRRNGWHFCTSNADTHAHKDQNQHVRCVQACTSCKDQKRCQNGETQTLFWSQALVH